MNRGLTDRARLHAALGDPLRLAIVEDLAVSDRSPKELGDRFGVATNLLTHHLGVLESAGLLERFVSAGDKRRRYVRLVRSPITKLGLTIVRPPAEALFVCTHNSARSQLAAALWQSRTGHRARSGGTHPATRVHPAAVAAAARAALDLTGTSPAPIDDRADAPIVVTVCDRAHEELQPAASWWHWSIPDPVDTGTDEAFDAVVADLDDRIGTFITRKGDPRAGDPPTPGATAWS